MVSVGHTFTIDGQTRQFEGFDGDMDTIDKDYTNTTLFFTREQRVYIEFQKIDEQDDAVILDKYHMEFMNTLIAVVKKAFEANVPNLELDLDQILDGIEGYDTVFEVWVTTKTKKMTGGTKLNTLYNTALLMDYSLLPVESLDVKGDYSVFSFNGRDIVEFGTEIERFPTYVSYSILQRELSNITSRNPLGFKIIDCQRLLSIGLTVQRHTF